MLALGDPECQASAIRRGRLDAPVCGSIHVRRRTQGLRTGHLVALAGAIAALASLWRPWYRIELPQSFRDMLNGQAARTPGAFGDLARGLAGMLPSRLEASGGQELQGADVVLCVGAVAVAALVVAAAGAFGPAVRVDGVAAG